MSKFRVLDTDNKTNSIYIQGSRATDTNNDISSVIFQNYDNDTKMTYDMAAIAVRDHFGDTSNNGIGDLIIKTNANGSSNMNERMRITYQGDVLMNTIVPRGKLTVDGNIFTSCNMIANVYLASSNDSTTKPSYSWNEDQSVGMYHASNNAIGFVTKNIERMRIDGNGAMNIAGNVISRSNITVYGTQSNFHNVCFSSNAIMLGSVTNAIGVPPTIGNLLNIRLLSSGTSYTPSAGTKRIVMHIQGGGGGGGGTNNVSNRFGGGGGAGGYGYVFINNTSDASSYTYSIGSGGTSALSTNGGTGGTTSITINGVTYSVSGGSGGSLGNSTNVVPGGAGGDIVSGNYLYSVKGDAGAPTINSFGFSGRGATSKYGSGGAEITSITPGNGNAGQNYGSGGSGGGNGNMGSNRSGGAGAPGVIVIEEYT